MPRPHDVADVADVADMDDVADVADVDQHGVEVVRSAEELRVARVRVPRERVRVSKRVVTEVRTVEVPVRVEQLVIEREPLDADGTAAPGQAATGAAPEPLEIVLREEVPVVSVRAEPVEVVRIGVRTTEAEQSVTAQLRTEHVDIDTAHLPERPRP
ncbi:DUF2382 domain-containing protein [Kineococcus sp. SYSU DK005]|uniref:DUF2382 domain-containing protein n=1 Tax=Kineococcus sp. SYSU DK005 TaxID=3383126 RepID=UPI003D7C819C